LNNPEILHKNARCGLHTVLPVKSMPDNLTVLIDKVKNSISIALFSSCKYTNFKHGRQILQDVLEMLPDFDVQLQGFVLTVPALLRADKKEGCKL